MRIRMPRVHGETRKEKLIRSIALVLVFAAVIWAFSMNNRRVVDMLNRESAIYDETGVMTKEDRRFVSAFTKSLRDEFGLESRIQVFNGDFVVPELDSKTLYIGFAPSIGEIEMRVPPLVRQALGQPFIDSLATRHLLPSFEDDSWPLGLQLLLTDLFTKLANIQSGTESIESEQ